MDSSSVVMYSETHGNMMLKHLRSLWEDELHTDVSLLLAGEKLIRSHKVVLSAGSRYFAAMLTSGLRESDQEEPIEIQGVDPRAGELLIRYIYTGEILLDHQVVEPVLYAADLFDMTEAVGLCCKFLLRCLTPYNALYTLRLGDRHNNKELYEAALKMVSAQFTEVVKSVDFLSAPPHQVVDLLASDNLNVKTEIPVLQGAMAWLGHNKLLRDKEDRDPSQEVKEEGEEGEEEDRTLSEKEEEVRERILGSVRYHLLPLNYLEGLSGDVAVRVAGGQISEAIKWRKCPPDARRTGSSPTWRSGMFGGKIYIAGGAGSSLAELSNPKLKLEMYDPVHSEWARQPEPEFMATEPHVGALASTGGYLYVIGGTDASGKPGKAVHRLHIETGVWEKMPALRTATTKPGVAVHEGMVYVAGGWNGSDLQCSFERYDPCTGLWQRLRNMNRNRMEFPMVECGGLLYSICGNTADFSNLAQSLEVYDPVTNGWTELQPTIRPRWCPGAAAVRDFIFICGLPGTDRASLREADKNYTVERFSPATGQWNIMPALANPVGGASLVAVASTLYVLGGSDGSAPLAACAIAQRYDVEAENWKSIAPMTMCRVGASTAVS